MRISRFVIAISLLAAPVAYADDGADNDSNTSQQPSHADPATKTLPASASPTAQANAFGQQGARMRAAHAAAKNAAAGEAHKAAGQAIAAQHRNAHATGHATGHGATGLDRAAAASGGRAHPH
jgi:hypothetical protein